MFGSGVWPVVQRELRAAARWPLGHWLRVGGALGGLVVFWISSDLPFDQVGVELFQRVHTLLLWLICAIVPALAADCLARERREGTLGLLFMTPLTASGIVLGKTFVQVLRALTVWLAVAPVLAIPFLSGGVTWADVAGFMVVELSVGFLCLAAGILASSLTDNRAAAFILAFLLMGTFVQFGIHFRPWKPLPRGATLVSWRTSSPGFVPRPTLAGRGGVFPGAAPGFWMQIPGGGNVWITPTGAPGSSLLSLPAVLLAHDFVISCILLLAALRFAGWCVERSWQDKPPSPRQRSLIKRYCTPVFRRWFASRMQRTLEWNPIAWLQQYSWKARLSKWGLCLLFILLECYVIEGNNPDALAGLVTALLFILAAAYTYAGVNGFLQEKRSGALELILVSPLSVQTILFGRVWGLWKQFFPSVLLLLASDIAVHLILPRNVFYDGDNGGIEQNGFWVKDLEIVAIYLTLPIIATFCALRFKSLFLSSALTVAIVFAPVAILLSFDHQVQSAGDAWAACFVVVVGNFLLAKPVLWLLRQNLQHRNYSY
jgi:ABC-type Na+ efflux pump permease subunit